MPIYNNLNNTKFKSKIAGFDFDWTLVNPKDDKTLPSDINDWEWYYDSVPDKIKEYQQMGWGTTLWAQGPGSLGPPMFWGTTFILHDFF